MSLPSLSCSMSWRSAAFKRIQQKLTISYGPIDEFVSIYSSLRTRPPAQSQEIQNVENWLLHRYRKAIFHSETDYIRHVNDLISIVPKIKTPLRRFLEQFRKFRLSRLFIVKKVSPMTILRRVAECISKERSDTERS